MSDFIPPLISSSPPPIPDFDDEDDDVEFGIDYNIADLDLPGALADNDSHKEKKSKILEIDGRRLEINGTSTNNWKCEEQDSTSQDSGLCMASQSSEGMSPLPQSDDEDKQNETMNNNVLNMKHSSTVMFNPDENNVKMEFDEDEHRKCVESNVLVNDTGQSDDIKCELKESVVSSSVVENGENYDSDSEFVWGSTMDNESSVFENHKSYQISDSNNIAGTEMVNNKENGTDEFDKEDDLECSKSEKFSDSLLDETSVKDTENCITSSASNDVEDHVTVADSICDSSVKESDTVISFDQSKVCCNNVEQNMETIDDDFDDDFGNFTSVTIPETCDSFSNNSNAISSFNNSVCELSSKIDLLSTYKEVKDTSLSDNLSGDESALNNTFSESLNDDVSSNIPISVNEHDDDIGEEDDFDDFSDFTQSVNVPVSASQHPEVVFDRQPSCSSILHQDSFEDLFPKSDDTFDPDTCVQQLECGPVWKHLCPLENSPALTFQWSNSRAHNRLLSALSIDSRNILFGPHWNANIPRFAANLGSNPLQPVKAVEVSLPGSSSLGTLVLDDAATVPDAHFDWGSSGLTNPLDSGTHSALLDLEILSTFDNLSTNNNSGTSKPISQDIEQLNDNCIAPSTTKVNLNVLSIEAESIISLLPDLNFMRKTYIEFLTNKD